MSLGSKHWFSAYSDPYSKLYCSLDSSHTIKYIIFHFFVAKRKCDKREIWKDPTKWLKCNELDPFRIGKNMTERKMPVPSTMAWSVDWDKQSQCYSFFCLKVYQVIESHFTGHMGVHHMQSTSNNSSSSSTNSKDIIELIINTLFTLSFANIPWTKWCPLHPPTTIHVVV